MNEGEISVTEPINSAYSWTREFLFDPFEVGNWFILGFAWFLASLSNPGNFNSPTFNAGADTNQGPAPSVLTEPWFIILIVVIVAGLFVLLQWLGSRGTFIFLDDVVEEEAKIKEPWSEFSVLGNSLFKVRLVLVFLLAVVEFSIGGMAYLLGRNMEFSDPATPSLILLVLMIVAGVLVFILYTVIQALLTDFVVQVMYYRDMLCLNACGVFWNEVLGKNIGSFFLFYLMKFILWIGAAIIMFLGGCLTCCIGFLPYLSNVIFLPIGVFFRNYPIHFLSQFGPAWTIYEEETVEKLF